MRAFRGRAPTFGRILTMRRKKTLLALPIALFWVAAACGQENDGNMRGYGAVLDNIDLLIDHYSGFLARKYDLTDEQNQYTRQMLRDRAHGFLDQNEDNMRGLIDELFDARSGGEMSAEGLLEWGRRAQPLYEQAKKLIVAGNEDWREVLTPEQKEIHDGDLELMRESFATTEDQLNRIASGEMTVDEFRNPRRHAKSTRRATARADTANADEPPPPPDPGEFGPGERPMDAAERRREIMRDRRIAAENPDMRQDSPVQRATPRRGQLDPPPDKGEPEPPESTKPVRRDSRQDKAPTPRRSAQTTATGFEGQWDKYVADFISRYNLDDAQQQQANAILGDCKSQANQYLQGRKGAVEQIDQQIAELQGSPGDKSDKDAAKKRFEQLSKLTKQKEEMREPLGRIFEKQLKPRLDRIPTRAQRRAAEAAATKGKRKKGKD
jgi:hypothetical protein